MPFRTSSTPASCSTARPSAFSMIFALLLMPAAALAQQTPAALLTAGAPQAAAAQPAGAASVRGSVTDPDDAAIPGAVVTLTPTSGKAITVNSGADGNYTARNVPAGTYSITVTMQGFATFTRPNIRVAAAGLTLNAKMAIQEESTIVNVTAAQNQVSVDPDSGAGMTVLTGKDLDALSDDPDELQAQLTALAGPAAGPNGGQIYIDGFTGGQLPPKASIREIRINQNPFSAQYDRAGFGRIEIFTKPGTDKFHGSIQTNFQDKGLNTGSPLAGNAVEPTYHTLFFIGNLTGPLTKKSSFTVSSSYRDIQNNSIVNPTSIYETAANTGVVCYPTQTGCIYSTNFTFAQLVPQKRWDISPRVDFAIGEKNTATVRFQFTHNAGQDAGIDATDLPSTGYSTLTQEATIQVSDTEIFSQKLINEIHFEYQRPTSSTNPYSTAPYVSVQGAFNGGGSNTGATNDTQQHIEFQNYTSISLPKNFIRFGGRLRTTSDSNTTDSGSNGLFTYTSTCNYTGSIASPAACANATAPPANSTLASYTLTTYPSPTINARTTDVGLYAETDWKVKPTWTVSYGLRFETQNYISDHADFAPRFSTAYALNKKTVLRLGAGLFFDRFSLGSQEAVVRNNGVSEKQYTGNAGTGATPVSTIPIGCGPTNVAACASGTNTAQLTVNSIASNLRAPYSLQTNIGIDQQLFRNATLALNYQHIHGVHQFNSDIPAFYPGGAGITAPTLNYQYQSEGDFQQNQLIANINIRNFHTASISGYYVLNFARADTGGIGSFPTIPGFLKNDYGRASYDVRHRVFLSGSYVAPHLISISPLLTVQSGSPYNITSGTEAFSDGVFNQRAVFAPAGTAPIAGGYVKTIGSCGTFATPGTPGATGTVPVNYCTGPASWTMNVRVVKTWGFGSAKNLRPDRPQQGQGGGNRAPAGGGGGGRGGGGAGGAGGGGGGVSSGKRYNVSFGVQAQNIFNIVDRNTYTGTLTSAKFGTSTNLAGGVFTSDSAVRRIYLQAGFTF